MADCGHGFGVGSGVRGKVEGVDLREEGCFAGVVEAKEEDGVFYGLRKGLMGVFEGRRGIEKKGSK